jgi:hypothetical protein
MNPELHQVLAVLLVAGKKIPAWSTGVAIVTAYHDWQDDQVLATFRGNDDGPWQSAHSVVGDLGLKAALRQDARGFFIPKASGWRAHYEYWKVAPIRWRHWLRRLFVIPSKEEADKILIRLWKRGLLVRAGWTHTKNEFYKLRD